MSKDKDFRPIITELKNQGWVIEQTTQGHFKAVPPDNNRPLVHFSASCEPRALKNTLQNLRNSGFMWPPSKRDSSPSSSAREPEWYEAINAAIEEAEANETPEARMDRLFTELKDAKAYLQLADDQLKTSKIALDEIQRAYEAALAKANADFKQAQIERDQAAKTLQGKKDAFDAAFSAAA